MLARVTSVQTAADKIAGLIKFSQEQAPAVRDAPGFKGLYLLADRQTGKVISIALWDSDDDLRRHEARGAQIREQVASEVGIASPAADMYEVVFHV